MADLIFDGRKLTVPPGTNLVDAGAKVGVSVPIFCYHKDLGAVGSCRVCAVTVKQGDKTRTVMGCMKEGELHLVLSADNPLCALLQNNGLVRVTAADGRTFSARTAEGANQTLAKELVALVQLRLEALQRSETTPRIFRLVLGNLLGTEVGMTPRT